MNRRKLRAAAGVVSLAVAVLSAATPVASGAEKQAARPAVKLTQVATVQSPTAGTPGPNGTLWIGERGETTSTVRVLSGQGLSDPVLTIETSADSDGLAGMEFDSDYSHFYLSYTGRDGHNIIEEFDVVNGAVQVGTRRTILFVEQQEPAHHSGHIAFGHDGMLYVAFGDGGHNEEGDPYNNAQNLKSLKGKMLRLDVAGGDPYAIPNNNPFAHNPAARGEIWAYGLRSPWQFSFDAKTGHLWIGDVGADHREEIDFAPGRAAGRNFGWPYMEGTRLNRGTEPANHTPPVYEYEHSGDACSVTGGFVYRGSAIPALRGNYVFADYCTGQLQAFNVRTRQAVDLGVDGGWVTAFVQGHNNELYVLDMGTFGDPDGDAIYRIDPA